MLWPACLVIGLPWRILHRRCLSCRQWSRILPKLMRRLLSSKCLTSVNSWMRRLIFDSFQSKSTAFRRDSRRCSRWNRNVWHRAVCGLLGRLEDTSLWYRCDSDKFHAFLRLCWPLHVEVRSTTPEFDKRYKELVKLRLNFKKATESYEKKIEMYNDAKSHHNEVRSQLHMMKLKLQEVRNISNENGLWLGAIVQICLSELKEEVEIILPDSKF